MSVQKADMPRSKDAEDEDGEEGEEDWGQAWDTECDRDEAKSRLSLLESAAGCNKTSASAGQSNREARDSTPGVSGGTEEKANLMSRMKLNDNKAGMEGLDRERINQIIYEASRGSRYYENELKKEEQMNRRADEQHRKLAALSTEQLQQGVIEADKLLGELEASRDLGRTIVHVDMDMFYAAVEMKDRPELRNKPMAVGGNAMLSTSNYLARRYGVRAAMPGFIGKKLCPDLVIVPASFGKYREVSRQVREILTEYDAHMCPMSLDEAYLDFTRHLVAREGLTDQERTYARRADAVCSCGCKQEASSIATKHTVVVPENKTVGGQPVVGGTSSDGCSDGVTAESALEPMREKQLQSKPAADNEIDHKSALGRCVIVNAGSGHSPGEACPLCRKSLLGCELFGTSGDEAVREMRFRIEQRTQLTASAGIAPNMMLAKVCSDRNKPNGQCRIESTHQAVLDFITELPIRKISGIGKVSERMLSALGVSSCAHLYQQRGVLFHLYSSIAFNYFMRIALGIGSTKVERESDRKSMSVERTFKELNKPAELYKKCYELCEALADDLKEEDLVGKTVTLKLKTVQFEVKTRAQTLLAYASETEHIYGAARDLLKAEIQACSPQPLRLRLMGVRMSSFQGACQVDNHKQRQETITGLFNKLHNKTSPTKGTAMIEMRRDQDNIQTSSEAAALIGSEIDGGPSASKSSSTSPVKVCSLQRPATALLPTSTQRQEASSIGQMFHKQVEKSAHLELTTSTTGEMGREKNEPVDLLTKSKVYEDPDVKFREDSVAAIPCSVATSSWETFNHGDVENETVTDSLTRGRSTMKPESGGGGHGGSVYNCPICNKPLPGEDLTVINRHVDKCLLGNSNGAQTSAQGAAKKHPRGDTNCDSVPPACDECSEGALKTDRVQEPSQHLKRNLPSPSSGGRITRRKPIGTIQTCDGYASNKLEINTSMGPSSKDENSHADALQTGTGSSEPKGKLEADDRGSESEFGVKPEFVCPICNTPYWTDDLQAFNQHVDSCLNRRAIRQVLEEQEEQHQLQKVPGSASTARHKRPGEGSSPAASSSASKKRKTNLRPQASKTIVSFFNTKLI